MIDTPIPVSRAVVEARKRAAGLVEAMTLDEKIAMVSSYFPLLSPRAADLGMIPSSGFTPGVPRLGVPDLRITDAGLGVANLLNARKGDTATALPATLATAATFDPEFAYAGGAVAGAEARAKTFNVLLGGGVNLCRDPWGGRNFEYFGEDALLSGRMAGAAVRGVQDQAVACTVKHFALNPQETGRMVVDSRIDPAALRESDLLAFQIAIEAGEPASVMAAYNRVDGEYASENADLLGVLKDEWAFDGWVMSDWGAVHSTEKAAMAGLDQESGVELDERLNGAIYFDERLKTAVVEGRVPAARLDDMVERILMGMIRSGVMDRPVPKTPQPIDSEAGAAAAQAVAEAGSVLLRNEAGLLPLSKDSHRILVVGGHADVGVLSGGGSSQVRSVGGAPIERTLETGDSAWFCRETYHASSPFEAIRRIAPTSEVAFDDGSDVARAARAASEAEVVIVFATQWRTEATDLETLALPDDQNALIAAVAVANPRTVVVLETGGAVLMPWLDATAAVLCAWYPGQRGGEAIARLLFGEVNPSGRLPLSFPASDADAPRPSPGGLAQMRDRDARRAAGEANVAIEPFAVNYEEGANVGYRWHEAVGRPPLFAFGYGLSYSRFEYAGLKVEGDGAPSASLEIANVGERAGSDVPQVYVQATDSQGLTTWRLAGFTRVALMPGEACRVTIPLEPRVYSRWDPQASAFEIDGPHRLGVGRSVTDLVLFDQV